MMGTKSRRGRVGWSGGWILSAACLVVALVAPALAEAASVTRSGGLITVTAGPGETNDVTVSEVNFAFIQVEDTAGVTPGGDCVPRSSTQGDCGDPTTVSKVVIQLGDGNDRARTIGTTRSFATDVDGGPGADTIDGHQSDDVLRGGDGNDAISGGDGRDQIFGGPGDDTLTGNSADDVLDGGPGRDSVNGDGGAIFTQGNDTIEVRDGEQDSVQCGLGADVVNADAIDVVDKVDCEQVNITPGVGTPPPAGNPPSPATATPRPSISAPATFLLSRLITRGMDVRLTFTGPCTATFGLVLPAPAARRLAIGRNATVLAGTTAKVRAAGAYTVRVRPIARFRRKLMRAGHLTALLVVACQTGGTTVSVARRKVVFGG